MDYYKISKPPPPPIPLPSSLQPPPPPPPPPPLPRVSPSTVHPAQHCATPLQVWGSRSGLWCFTAARCKARLSPMPAAATRTAHPLGNGPTRRGPQNATLGLHTF
ncbi:hypothetical protein E2C01_030840 [Portunus trituberculatus]|uniref:Uncharacterized protein n=1 Tax=Portunus trituberculatus TaxID=210409 RepID=A0A5B7EVZ7_PORTR|nr:hypothetical protein [Portunus trituberculatus]